MQGFNRQAFVEPERAQAPGRDSIEAFPANALDRRRLIQGQFVKSHARPVSMIRNLRAIIINTRNWPVSSRRIAQATNEPCRTERWLQVGDLRLGFLETHHAFNPATKECPGFFQTVAFIVQEYSQSCCID